MLAGRQDGAFLDNYVKNFSRDFGTDGVIEDGYGFRWRHGYHFDQLNEIILQLKKDPGTRQCVLQMWGAGRTDLLANKAKPCNLVATFRIEDDHLDMTVFNRSNDVIWGCCGANAVHFAIMQEYLATMIGLKIGNYWQVSTNLHLYKLHEDMLLKRVGNHEGKVLSHFLLDPSEYGPTYPLITSPENFDDDLTEVMACIDDIHAGDKPYVGNISNTFLTGVVLPMARAYRKYRERKYVDAISDINEVLAHDWRQAGLEWLKRRIK